MAPPRPADSPFARPPAFPGPITVPKRRSIVQPQERIDAVRDYNQQVLEAMQQVPRMPPYLPSIPLDSGGYGGGGLVGPHHPGPDGSRLLEALSRAQQVIMQGMTAREQSGGYPGMRGISPDLRNAARQGGLPTDAQSLQDYYEPMIRGGAANVIPDVGTEIRATLMNSPEYQRIVHEAARNAGIVRPAPPQPPAQPTAPPATLPVPPYGYNPDMPIGPNNVSPGAPGTGHYYPANPVNQGGAARTIAPQGRIDPAIGPAFNPAIVPEPDRYWFDRLSQPAPRTYPNR